VQVTSVLPVAKMVGSNRVVQGGGIVHVCGDPDLPPQEEKKLRQTILMQAFEALKKQADAS
jgi:glycine reductase complex component B subunit gamma